MPAVLSPLHATVYVVDDDSGVRLALAWLLRTRRLLHECFDSAEAFDARLQADRGKVAASAACVLLDVRMGGISGLAMFDKIIAYGLLPTLPVIFLTGHADVPTAVAAVRRGAFDFCEKPFSTNALVDRLEQALAASAVAIGQQRLTRALQLQLAALSARETSVMQQALDGLPNRHIAQALGISVRTVEVDRARVFDKMGVRSVVELASLLHAIDFAQSPGN